MTNFCNNIKQKDIILNVIIIVSFIFISVASYWMLLRSGSLFGAWDIQFHVRRILDLNQSLHSGNWFPQFGLNYFHGALDFIMYPYINLYLIVFIYHFLKLKILSIYVFFIINTFLGLLISFYSSYSAYHFRITSYLFALIYNISGFFFAFCLNNMDLGTVSAYIFPPLVLFGFINLLKKQHWLGFSTGVSLLILSHVISTILVICLLILLVIINFRRLQLVHFIAIAKAAFLTICITAFFWLPALFIGMANYGDITPPRPSQITGFNFSFFSNSFYPFPNYYSISLFALMAIILAIFYYRKFDRIIKQLYIISILILIMCSDWIPWPKITAFLPIMNNLQKLYRLYIIPQLILTFIFALMVTRYVKQSKKSLLIFAIIVFVFQIQGQNMMASAIKPYPTLTSKYVSEHPIDNLSKGQNYKLTHNDQLNRLCSWQSDKDDYFPKKVVSNNKLINDIHQNQVLAGHYLTNLRSNGNNYFTFRIKKSAPLVRMPFVLYHGEKVKAWINGYRYKVMDLNDQMAFRHLKRGKYSIKIIPSLPNQLIWLIVLLFSIGVMIYFYELIKKAIKLINYKESGE